MPTPLPSTALEWACGLASLSPGVSPCPGSRPYEWTETHRRCSEFIERWGMHAHAAGWNTLRLFEVGPETGALRGDFCGILIPCICDVTEVTDEWIQIGNARSWRHEPVKMPGMIPARETKR